MTRRGPESYRPLSRVFIAGFGGLLLILAAAAGALPDDSQQPIRISADQALRDDREGVTVYTGNVRMQQGSLQIEADKVTLHHRQDAPDKIVATGSPARMQQQPEIDQQPVRAAARMIEYFKTEERVYLTRDARIEQSGSIVTGDTIEYLFTEQRIRAEADRNGDKRVEVVIPGEALEQDDEAASGTTQGE